MKKMLTTICAVVCVVALAKADTTYVFKVNMPGTNWAAGYASTNALPYLRHNGQFQIHCSKDQWGDGSEVYFKSLPHAVVTNSIELARAEEADVTDWDAQVKALALVYLDEINILRAEHGLPPRTKKQLQSALKAKMED